jgi:hypothetical protein
MAKYSMSALARNRDLDRPNIQHVIIELDGVSGYRIASERKLQYVVWLRLLSTATLLPLLQGLSELRLYTGCRWYKPCLHILSHQQRMQDRKHPVYFQYGV